MVAAWFDRAQFSCAQCDQVAAQGGDLRGENSGKPGSCEGPTVYHAYKHHPSGGIRWAGCPRLSSTPRTEAFLRAHDLADGKLSATEQRVAPWALFDAFQAIDFVAALREWERAKNLAAQAERR